jgi:hypothetical protein
VIKNIKLAIMGAFLLVGYAPFFSYSTGLEGYDYIDVEAEESEGWWFENSIGPALEAQPLCESMAGFDIHGSPAEFLAMYDDASPNNKICNYSNAYNSRVNLTINFRVEFLYVCTNPTFNIGEDIDGDGNYDHCHKIECSKRLDFFAIDRGVVGTGCVEQPQGGYWGVRLY